MRYRKLKKRWKYQLGGEFSRALPVEFMDYCQKHGPINTDYMRISEIGVLYLKPGYAWDGPSGFMRDTRTAMIGSLMHDALYGFLRLGLLPYEPFKVIADDIFRDVCIDQGMAHWRARNARRALKWFGRPNKAEKGDVVNWIEV